MTVPTETSKSGPYAGAGTPGPFVVDFPFLEDGHLRVVKTDTDGVDTVLTLNVDYNVSGAGGSSGTVTLTDPLAVGEMLTIVRSVPVTQEADYVPNDPFPAQSHERALDKLTMIAQQHSEILGRALQFPEPLTGLDPVLPRPAPGKALVWNQGGTGIRNSKYDADAIADAAAQSAADALQSAQDAAQSAADADATYKDLDKRYLGEKPSDPSVDNEGNPLQEGALYWNTTTKAMRVWTSSQWTEFSSMAFVPAMFSGDDVETEFELPLAPISVSNVFVSVGGVDQTGAFTVIGSKLIFDEPPPTGTDNIRVKIAQPLPVNSALAENVVFRNDGPGAWTYNVAQKLKAWVTPEDFGAIGDGQSHPLSERYATLEDAQEDYPFATSLTQEIDYCAIVAAINSRTFGTGIYVSGPEIWLRGGAVYVCGSNTIQLKKSVKIVGPNSGLPSTSAPALTFDDGVIGIIVHRYDTIDDTVEAVPTTGGDGSVLEGFRLLGGRGSVYDGTSHGIWLRARAIISRLFIDNWGGNGINIVATATGAGGVPVGNANNWHIDSTVRIQGCRHGIFIDGADVNAGVAIHPDCSNNLGWGIWDSSFLGNVFIGPHANSNGINSKSRVHYNGNRYACIRSAESGSPNKGLAPDTNPTHWKLVGAGGASSTYLDWDSDIEYQEGGGYKTDNTNAQTIFVGAYMEGGQYAEFAQRTIVLGGTIARGDLTDNNQGTVFYGTTNGATWTERPLAVVKGSGSTSFPSDITVRIGDPNSGTILFFQGGQTSEAIRLAMRDTGVLELNRSNSANFRAFAITLNSAPPYFGRSSQTDTKMFAPELFLSRDNNLANGRSITFVNALPTSGECARGDVLINRQATAGQSMGWQVVVGGVFGSTAEVKALPAIAA